MSAVRGRCVAVVVRAQYVLEIWAWSGPWARALGLPAVAPAVTPRTSFVISLWSQGGLASGAAYFFLWKPPLALVLIMFKPHLG